MVDIAKLRTAIDESGMTIVAIASKSGIVRETLYNRLTRKSEFTISEVERISDTLHLTVGERNAIFFAKEVSSNET